LSETKDYSGVGGPISFAPNGDVIKPLRLMTVRQGKFVALNEE